VFYAQSTSAVISGRCQPPPPPSSTTTTTGKTKQKTTTKQETNYNTEMTTAKYVKVPNNGTVGNNYD